jgi:acetyl esterase/lipase
LLLGGLAAGVIPARGADAPPAGAAGAGAPQTIPLWPQGAPGALGTDAADEPTITVYPAPPNGSGPAAAVVVCPGGGYGGLAGHEGEPIARWLNTLGITGVVVKYRLGPKYHHPAMLHDARRAIRTVRANAREWNVDPAHVGILGFSAGGHLAATASTQFDAGNPDSPDPVERLGSRPDVSVLVYPVITMTDPHTHQGSRRNLLGDRPTAEQIDAMSAEKRATKQTPPAFIFHTADDQAVPVENAMLYAAALRKNGVPFELHVYEHGRHGVGLAQDDPILKTWTARCADWLRRKGFGEPGSAGTTKKNAPQP